MQKRYLEENTQYLVRIMSVEEFVKELQECNREDFEEIEKLLEVLEEIQEEEKRVYTFFVTSNL
jgi:DNA-binding transcriptional regulator/RsmH inhibitor MraZ